MPPHRRILRPWRDTSSRCELKVETPRLIQDRRLPPSIFSVWGDRFAQLVLRHSMDVEAAYLMGRSDEGEGLDLDLEEEDPDGDS
jgi:hypothetical protein